MFFFFFLRKCSPLHHNLEDKKAEDSVESFNHHTKHQQQYYTKINFNSKIKRTYPRVKKLESKTIVLYFCYFQSIYRGYSQKSISFLNQHAQNSIRLRIRLNKSPVQFFECFKPLYHYTHIVFKEN